MTRNGKIARLPHFIREELNQRLFDGEPGVKLIDWLHEQEVVWEVLEENGFDEITEQNLSEWKNGGYQSWVDNREARELVMRMTSRADDLGESIDGENLGDCVATLLMVELIKVARVLVQQEEDPQKRWKELRRVGKELSRHRRDRARDIRVDINQKRCDWAEEDRERKWTAQEKERLKKKQLAPYDLELALHLKAERLGGGAVAKRMAAHLLEVQHDLPTGRLTYQDNGVWMWEEDEWVWYADRRKEGKGYVEEEWVEVEVRAAQANEEEETPKTKHQAPGKHQSSSPKVVESQQAKDSEGKSAPTDVGGYENKDTAREDSRPTTTEANQDKNQSSVAKASPSAKAMEDESEDRPNPTESDQIQPFNE